MENPDLKTTFDEYVDVLWDVIEKYNRGEYAVYNSNVLNNVTREDLEYWIAINL